MFCVSAIVIFDHFFITPLYALQINEQNNAIKRSPISSFQKLVSSMKILLIFYLFQITLK